MREKNGIENEPKKSPKTAAEAREFFLKNWRKNAVSWLLNGLAISGVYRPSRQAISRKAEEGSFPLVCGLEGNGEGRGRVALGAARREARSRCGRWSRGKSRGVPKKGLTTVLAAPASVLALRHCLRLIFVELHAVEKHGVEPVSFDGCSCARHSRPCMAHPALAPLLILQDRDMKRLNLEAQLKAIPTDIARVEQKIAEEKGAIETARKELLDLEVKKKHLENEIGSSEAKVGQYRVQQLSIKKNDEYQAMGQQIETMVANIADLEGKELEVMYAIDEAKKKFACAEAVLKANISGHEARIKVLRERGANLEAEHKAAQAEVSAARPAVGDLRLRVYDRISARNMPAVVPLHGGKCGGCHLKVSSEVESAARGKGIEPTSALPTCDQCGRIVYWEL